MFEFLQVSKYHWSLDCLERLNDAVQNASWYMGPPEKPPPFPQDPARPGVHTKGGWINRTMLIPSSDVTALAVTLTWK